MPPRLILALLLAVITAMVGARPARAQASRASKDDTPPPALESYRENVMVRARALVSGGAAVTEIDRKTIEASQARTAAELLRLLAGVHVLSTGSRGGFTVVQMRGGDPNFALVLLDGIPLNNSTNTEGGAFNLASLPASVIERIEVARGPLSYFYGSYALSGVIHIVTRRGESAAPALEADLEAGSASFLRASSTFSGKRGNSDYFLGVGWESEDRRRGDDHFDEAHLHGSAGVELRPEARLRVTGRVALWDSDDYPEASGGPELGSGELRRSENDELSLGADLAWETSARWKQRLAASLHRHGLHRTSPGIGFQVPPSVEETLFTRARLGWLSTVSLTGRLQLNAGVDLEHERGSNDSVLFLPPFLGGNAAGDYSLARTTPGAFAEFLTEQGRWLLEAGLRADAPGSSPAFWSPRLAARYALTQDTRLRGSVSRAFKLPSFFVLGSPRQLGGNPDLSSETSVGGDFGVEHDRVGGAFSAGARVFANRYQDLVDFDFDLFRFVNRSSVGARGLELTFAWNPRSDLAVALDGTWQRVRDRDSGEAPLHQPEWLGSARLTWDPRPAVTLRAEARWTSSSLDRQIPVPDRTSVDGYAVVDLAASWRVADRWQIRGRLENLTDARFENFIGFPEPGLSVRIGLHYGVR